MTERRADARADHPATLNRRALLQTAATAARAAIAGFPALLRAGDQAGGRGRGAARGSEAFGASEAVIGPTRWYVRTGTRTACAGGLDGGISARTAGFAAACRGCPACAPAGLTLPGLLLLDRPPQPAKDAMAKMTISRLYTSAQQ